MDNELKIKVTNHLTGEISEVEVKGPDQAANLYVQFKASQRALEKATKQLLSYIDTWLGSDDKQPIGDGYYAVRQQRETRTWTREGLRKVGLDSDAIDTLSKVNMALAKEVISESIERGDIKPNAIKELNELAEVATSKPFVLIK